MSAAQSPSYGSIDDHNRPTPRPSPSLRAQEAPPTLDNIETHKNDNILDRLGISTSYTLENKGSVARDHMANERTFLAWLRTSLAFITIGIGVTQLLRIDRPGSTPNSKFEVNQAISLKLGKTIGSIFIIIGILSLLFGCQRYFEVQNMLTKNHYPAARLGILALIVLVLTIILFTFFMVIKS
ncbi:uncharacterized protein SPAPADRAFT_59708 [Spathaspora passalidarum NRRL Y-27907]|uniref:DUF202 domain-containing protein n=1 Tax=Spathaspora passalidarum (strain NRRL Y-27907 / 11-Y1) TaxID=619300 RepID=G3AHX7_SPAPN|nr:uncharacterized protein SPAPADRAFT_59708 [Spathaspora passalidarum NRRL Y-27907]EGW34291.1 hypothetical protein SPAPADRAFT_59708 [Spathaspora passalidarum NRRL Y-27907]